MLGPAFTEWQRTQLTAVCGYWTATMSESQRNRCLSQILDAFDSWKEAQTDANGMVPVSSGGLGLLSPTVASELRPASQTPPWECAGPHVRDRIDLAFHLWFENFAPFQQLISEHRLPVVFAITGAMTWRDAAPDSLVRLNGFLTHLLASEAHESAVDAAKHRNSTRHLPSARIVSAMNRSERSKDLFHKAHQMAVEYRRENPDADEDQIVRYLRKYDDFKVWKGESSLRRAIKGSLRSLTSLRRDVDTKRPS